MTRCLHEVVHLWHLCVTTVKAFNLNEKLDFYYL